MATSTWPFVEFAWIFPIPKIRVATALVTAKCLRPWPPWLQFPFALNRLLPNLARALMAITHPSFPRLTRTFTAAFAFVAVASAQSLLPPAAIPLDSLAAFKSPATNWQLAGGIAGDPRTGTKTTAIVGVPGTGVLINNPTESAHSHLITTDEYGDAEIDLDFLLTPGANSGVYLMGRYEVQLLDSWGVKAPTYGDCAGIYQRWDPTRGAGHEGYEGAAPTANACRAPGLWQHLHIEFRAPRFDALGKKISNAQVVRVVLNDFVVQQNVELTGPTRASLLADEAPFGPLMIQGDHGHIALRALAIKRFDATAPQVQVEDLAYKLYPVDPKQKGSFDSVPPSHQGTPAAFSSEAVEKNGLFSLVFTGTFVTARAGSYAFSADSAESVGLTIDGQPAIQPLNRGGQSLALQLSSGRHAFRLDYHHASSWGKPGFSLFAEGPGLARHRLTASLSTPAGDKQKSKEKPRSIFIEPTADRVRLQRSFVPFDPKKRLYAINVGTPAGLHYSYDFETGALLRVWRGGFLDTFELWDGRAENQLALPTGPALTLSAKPVLALLERYSNDWPDQPDAMWSSQGYTLEPDGQPTFHFKLSTLTATDRIAPDVTNHGFIRTLVVTGNTVSWESWVLLAEAEHITPQPDGHSYLVGDRTYYLDLPADSTIHPILRTRNGRQQLIVPINATTLGQPIVYSLVW